eukprot:s2220_g7.t1
MSRARGRPFYIDGVRHEGPPALQDEYNVIGFRNPCAAWKQDGPQEHCQVQRAGRRGQGVAPVPQLVLVHESHCGVGKPAPCSDGRVQQLLLRWEQGKVDSSAHQLRIGRSVYSQALRGYFEEKELFSDEEQFRVQQLMQELSKYSRFQDPELKQKEAHINKLEGLALVAHLRRLLKDKEVKQLRVMIAIDSQVLLYANRKGKESVKTHQPIAQKADGAAALHRRLCLPDLDPVGMELCRQP